MTNTNAGTSNALIRTISEADFIQQVNAQRLAQGANWYFLQVETPNGVILIKGVKTWVQIAREVATGLEDSNPMDQKVSEYKRFLGRVYRGLSS